MIICFCFYNGLGDTSNNEARYAGMKEEDYKWVADHMKMFREEIAKRRNSGNAAEQDSSVRNLNIRLILLSWQHIVLTQDFAGALYFI